MAENGVKAFQSAKCFVQKIKLNTVKSVLSGHSKRRSKLCFKTNYCLMGKIELVALLSLSSWCLVIVVGLFLAVQWVCLQFVIVVFSDHTHLLFLIQS